MTTEHARESAERALEGQYHQPVRRFVLTLMLHWILRWLGDIDLAEGTREIKLPSIPQVVYDEAVTDEAFDVSAPLVGRYLRNPAWDTGYARSSRELGMRMLQASRRLLYTSGGRYSLNTVAVLVWDSAGYATLREDGLTVDYVIAPSRFADPDSKWTAYLRAALGRLLPIAARLGDVSYALGPGNAHEVTRANIAIDPHPPLITLARGVR